MRKILGAGMAVTTLALAACGRNEPGTMGGVPGAPETVATGAPAQAARATSRTDPDQPALRLEHKASSYDDRVNTNNPPPPIPEAPPTPPGAEPARESSR